MTTMAEVVNQFNLDFNWIVAKVDFHEGLVL